VLDAIAATLVPAKAGDIPIPARPSSGPPPAEDDAFAPTMSPMGVDDLKNAMAAQGLAAPARPGWAATPPSVKTAPYARLISVTRDGRDGDAFPLTLDHIHIGRVDGDLLFPADLFLAPRHARLERRGQAVVVHPIDTVNGVYLKITEAYALADGDQFLCGRELFRFEAVDPAERDVVPGVQQGIHLLGSPPRVPWGRLRQLIISGATRDVLFLSRPEIVLGREEGDFRFSDDEFMSRRHLTLTLQGTRPQLQDLGSSNGTYVRLRGERALRPSDLLRMGDQLLRFEPV
jgi:pSer/pThr/pTyr-binding forkhead associated (FHA) protein